TSVVRSALAAPSAAARRSQPSPRRAALDRIGRGDYRARIATTGCTELARLGEGCERLAAALGAASAERTTLVRRLVAVQEQERAALALELHDEFGQHLSVIRANAAGMLSPGAGAGIAADVARIEGSAAHLMQLVRERLRALRPWSEHASLSDSLRELAADVGGGSGGTPVVLELDAPATLDAVPRPLALAVYRIVQESLTNAVRHAGASRITASVSCTESALLVVVSDDGRGYEPACRHRGAGMGGIEERTRACGGQVAFVRNDDGGLCVRAAFPWSATPPVGAP
ncbi:MAG: histidine kinase, partial [Gammaproteobacteria bacterium]